MPLLPSAAVACATPSPLTAGFYDSELHADGGIRVQCLTHIHRPDRRRPGHPAGEHEGMRIRREENAFRRAER
jgi:hypothetical protein